ncbi:DUF3303 domain-containing protein [Paraburkholderia sp. DGU8]|jgi:hypothetical protein|uniref:DUF3303 domain-containing protein n=1 Tax=Paraburkholderia sp. DGU8 TaxID=3161997 RepID=UPI0034671076
MKFMMTFHWAPDTQQRAEAIARFQQTGGLPPDGVRLVGRWTRADLGAGFDLLETDDMKKLTEFAYQWSDLMELDIVPVLDDAELSEVLGRVVK